MVKWWGWFLLLGEGWGFASIDSVDLLIKCPIKHFVELSRSSNVVGVGPSCLLPWVWSIQIEKHCSRCCSDSTVVVQMGYDSVLGGIQCFRWTRPWATASHIQVSTQGVFLMSQIAPWAQREHSNCTHSNTIQVGFDNPALWASGQHPGTALCLRSVVPTSATTGFEHRHGAGGSPGFRAFVFSASFPSPPLETALKPRTHWQ